MEIKSEFKLRKTRVFLVEDREFLSLRKAIKFKSEVESYPDKFFYTLEYYPEFQKIFNKQTQQYEISHFFRKKQILMADSILGLLSYISKRFPETMVDFRGHQVPVVEISEQIEVESYEDFLKLVRTPVDSSVSDKFPKVIKINKHGEVKK